MTDQNIVDRIAALLAKAESTNHEAEAEAFNAKAQELMLKYAIDEAALKASGGKTAEEPIVLVTIPVKEKLQGTRARQGLVGVIATTMNCRAYIDTGRHQMKVAGYESDARFTQMLFMSLMLQQQRFILPALRQARERFVPPVDRDGYCYEHGRRDHAQCLKFREGVWRRNFINAYCQRVGARIQERYVAATQEAGESVAIVLKGKGDRVRDWLSERVILGSAKPSRRTAYNHDAAVQGGAAGNAADISGGRN
jgi:hypothetical protein